MKQTGYPEPFCAWRRPWFWPAVVMGMALFDSISRGIEGISLPGGITVTAVLHIYSLCLPERVGRQISIDDQMPLVLLMPPLLLLLLTFAVSTRGGKGHSPPGEAEQWELARHLVLSARLVALLWVAVGGVQWWAMSLHSFIVLLALPWAAFLPLALLVWWAVRGPHGRRRPTAATSAEQAGPGDAAGNTHG